MKENDISHGVHLNVPIDKVNEFVTKIDFIRKWWTPKMELAENIGDITILRFYYAGIPITARFKLEEKRDNKVVWNCVYNDDPIWLYTKIVFELIKVNKKTNLFVTHTGIEDRWTNTNAYKSLERFWEKMILRLKEFIETTKHEYAVK